MSVKYPSYKELKEATNFDPYEELNSKSSIDKLLYEINIVLNGLIDRQEHLLYQLGIWALDVKRYDILNSVWEKIVDVDSYEDIEDEMFIDDHLEQLFKECKNEDNTNKKDLLIKEIYSKTPNIFLIHTFNNNDIKGLCYLLHHKIFNDRVSMIYFSSIASQKYNIKI